MEWGSGLLQEDEATGEKDKGEEIEWRGEGEQREDIAIERVTRVIFNNSRKKCRLISFRSRRGREKRGTQKKRN